MSPIRHEKEATRRDGYKALNDLKKQNGLEVDEQEQRSAGLFSKEPDSKYFMSYGLRGK
jgi:hypothetical protein